MGVQAVGYHPASRCTYEGGLMQIGIGIGTLIVIIILVLILT